MSDLPQVGSDFGYQFEPASAADQPGHRKLTVVMRSAATDEHFDPDKIECRVADSRDELDSLVIFHPWSLLSEYKVAAGRVTVMSRHGQKLEALMFGGTLRLDSSVGRTIAVFESTAPVLALLPEHPFLNRVAAEAEGLLARRQAAWDSQGQPGQFEARLARADPLALYQACLHTLRQALAHGGVFGGAPDKALEHLITAAGAAGYGETLEELV